MYVCTMYSHVFVHVSITGLPWGLVSSLPRSIQTLVAQSGVDRKSLSIVDTIIRGECFGTLS